MLFSVVNVKAVWQCLGLNVSEKDGQAAGKSRSRVARSGFARLRRDKTWLGEGVALGGAVGDLVADDGAEFCVGVFLVGAVADAAEVEVGAIADEALVLVGPADEAVVTVRLRGATP